MLYNCTFRPEKKKNSHKHYPPVEIGFVRLYFLVAQKGFVVYTSIRTGHLRYLPNHLNCIVEIGINHQRIGDFPITVSSDDTNISKAHFIQHAPQHLGNRGHALRHEQGYTLGHL